MCYTSHHCNLTLRIAPSRQPSNLLQYWLLCVLQPIESYWKPASFKANQCSPFPTARRPGASKTTSRASGFEQILPTLFHISRSKNFKILEVGQVMILRKGKPCQYNPEVNFILKLTLIMWWMMIVKLQDKPPIHWGKFHHYFRSPNIYTVIL